MDNYTEPTFSYAENFASVATTTAPTDLPACIVGPCYKVHRSSNADSLTLVGAYAGAAIAPVALPGLSVAAGKVSNVKLFIKNPIIVDDALSTLSADVVVALPTKITLTTVVVLASGSYLKLTKGADTIIAKVLSSSRGATTTTVYLDKSATTLGSGITVARMKQLSATYEVAASEYTYDEGTIEVTGTPDLLVILDSSTTASAYIGELRVEYRELITDGALVLTSYVYGQGLEIGSLDTDNLFGLCVYGASLGNGPVYCIKTKGATLADYQEALGQLEKNEAIHGICVASTDETIIAAADLHVKMMSTPAVAKKRVGWFGADVPATAELFEGTATIADGLITLAGANDSLFDLGVQSGDTVRVISGQDTYGNDVYQTAVVSEVVTAKTAELSDVLVGSLSAIYSTVDVASGSGDSDSYTGTVQIVRQYTNTQYAAAVAALSGDDYRIRRVWVDNASISGIGAVPNAVVAAIAAGMRAGNYPHAPMTNSTVPWITVGDDRKLTPAEMNVMGAAGIMVVEKSTDGASVIRHQLTTNLTNAHAREDSVVCAADACIRSFRALTIKDRGQVNLTDSYLASLQVAMQGRANELMSLSVYPESIGALLQGFAFTAFQRSPVNDMKLICKTSLTLPKPLNDAEFTFNLF